MVRIGIISSWGVPPRYGGLETLTWHISKYLSEKNFVVYIQTVAGNYFNPGEIIPRNIYPEYFTRKDSFIGDIVYDLKAFYQFRETIDLGLVLGYGSAPFISLLKMKKIPVILHTAGMEWTRPRFNFVERVLLRQFEKIGVILSDHLIVDNIEIQNYMNKEYCKASTFIPYGAETFEVDPLDIPVKEIKPNNYFLFIGRLEPSMSVEFIISEFVKSNREENLLLVGPILPSYQYKLKLASKDDERVIFTGGIYGNSKGLYALRKYSYAQINGNRTGGTSPSLVEAISAGKHIIAHNNKYSRAALGPLKASFFNYSINSLTNILNKLDDSILNENNLNDYSDFFLSNYTWNIICKKYYDLITDFLTARASFSPDIGC